jgi:hypothetical protein
MEGLVEALEEADTVIVTTSEGDRVLEEGY